MAYVVFLPMATYITLYKYSGRKRQQGKSSAASQDFTDGYIYHFGLGYSGSKCLEGE